MHLSSYFIKIRQINIFINVIEALCYKKKDNNTFWNELLCYV
jgi:hypothetical protein